MKKNTWKGVNEDEIEKLSFDEFMKKIGSRERRTLLKVKSNPPLRTFMEKVRLVKAKNPKKLIKTHIREAVILPEWIGLTFAVHNGKEFKKVEITLHKIGKRLGDYSHSVGRVIHSGPGVGATRGSKFVPLK
ncbi:ribosomal protein S19 family protein [Candidatus Micrarchaeota archaeon]|nr:ribosomal protein S19 family protein [Candidatus Micrarchaeota archaeon]